MMGHDGMTAADRLRDGAGPETDDSFAEECKEGLVIGLELIGLIALAADIFVFVVS